MILLIVQYNHNSVCLNNSYSLKTATTTTTATYLQQQQQQQQLENNQLSEIPIIMIGTHLLSLKLLLLSGNPQRAIRNEVIQGGRLMLLLLMMLFS